jgi:hypothetical protein
MVSWNASPTDSRKSAPEEKVHSTAVRGNATPSASTWRLALREAQ